MNTDASQLRRLVFWNRFWLVLVTLFLLFGGFFYFAQSVVSDGRRLHVRWTNEETDESGKPSLVFSSEQGGPFIVTQLVTDGDRGMPDTALAAIAQLPHPLFVRGPKAQTFFTAKEMAQLDWIDSQGKKMAPPKPNMSVMALYYETQKVMTTK